MPAPISVTAPLPLQPMSSLNIQVPVVDVAPSRQEPIYRPAPQRSDALYWVAVALLIGLIAYLIYLFWDRIRCLFSGCPRVQQVDMLDHGCSSYIELYCDCCPEPIRVCCTDPWVQQQFSHWSNNPQVNQMLLDGACQRLFGNDSAQHQRLAYASASAPPCQPRPTPLAPASAPAAAPAAPSPLSPTVSAQVYPGMPPPAQGHTSVPPMQGYSGLPANTARPVHSEPPGIPQPGSGDML